MAILAAQRLINGVAVPAVGAAVYTVPGSFTKVKLDPVRIVNHSAVPVVVDIWILMNGESAADNFKALDTYTIPANTSELVGQVIGDVLDTGGSIEAEASVAASVSISATGTGFTA